jgi:nicotinamidase/pyrazinamidase
MTGTVFFDIDTQLDFLYPAGALYVPGAEAIVDRVAGLNHWAAKNGIPVVSTMDAHSENDPEFRDWPPHCIVGTLGQRKPASTLLEKRVIAPNTPGLPETEAAEQILAEQVLLEKQALDCFTNVNLTGLLHRLGAERCVVYGVVTEICVKFAAMGLLKTGRRVELVCDAVKELDPAAGAKMMAEFAAAGGTLTSSEQLFGG